MKRKWLIVAVAAFWLSAMNCRLFADSVFSDRTTEYSVEYQNWKWYQKFVIYLLGYEFLNWQEIELKETFRSDPQTGKKFIVALSFGPKNIKSVLDLKSTDGEITGHANLISDEEFKREEVLKILEMLNYVYDETQSGNFEIESSELFINKKGTLHCKLEKINKTSQRVITVATFTKSKQSSSIEITLASEPEPIIEKMVAELRSGQKVIFTKKPPS
ncbi:MAG: hypothetical protein A3B16_02830 [Candidatus Zambryskibacteria bacterium RIFCSPLOWO2_01_FULL_45_43]|uniref:Lipoprotein n=2 Tax=Parcubacteria group TaxID=1794811 RepID=A0A1G1ZTA2_9BACT|nr:MAG: hypothetical protein A3H63_00660 [Candidatus Harrisonbacteria bacterium RIFCSPLOWO2_02_FULL_45_10c]OHB06211.1 MAG: hypothetical protein A3B16_02830 [Candidatus Zambryskibacteria bacterium RIFCSPLOWO2_01_FULL_45_43]